jgi:tetratricopeptide (TPR) repeat protein
MWDAAPLRKDVRDVIYHGPPAVRDTEPIRSVKAFLCDEDVPLMERARNLILIARWQGHVGLDHEAVTTLYAALDTAEKAYASQVPPKMGYNHNWGERVAHHLIELNADEDKVLHAVEVGESVRIKMHDPRSFDPRYTREAAKTMRHTLVAPLVEHEKTPVRRARAWADAAMGYRESGDDRRAVAAAKRSVEEMDRVPSERMEACRLDRDWRLETAFILWNASERDLAKKALRRAEKGNRLWTDELVAATGRLRIGDDDEARRRIKQCYAKIPERSSSPKEETWMREKGWIIIAIAYAERGDLEEAENTLANIPAKSQNRMRGVRFVGRVLLDRGDSESKEAARDFFARHARFSALAEKTSDDDPPGHLTETVYCAAEAARAGAIDVVETQFLPAMTPKEQETVLRHLAINSTELPLDERIRRFVSPQSDAAKRVDRLLLIAGQLRDNEALNRVEWMILEEEKGKWSEMAGSLMVLAEHRRSLNHWEREQELFDQALACTNAIEQEHLRARHLNGLMVRAWMCGRERQARKIAEQLIDVVWQTRSEDTEEWKSGGRARCALAARELLEATKKWESEAALERE